MKVEITSRAQRDLNEIVSYLAAESPSAAVRLGLDLRSGCRSLGELPDRYPLVPGREVEGLRRMTCRNHLVLYRVLGDRVQVLRVLHGARDWRALFDEP